MMNVRWRKFRGMPTQKDCRQEKDFFAFENSQSTMRKKKGNSAQKIKLVCPCFSAVSCDSILKKTLTVISTTDRESLGNIKPARKTELAPTGWQGCGRAITGHPF